MKMFTSLEDLNKFLTEELGLEPLPQEMVDQGIAAAVAQAGPDAEEAVASFSFSIPEEASEASVIDEDAFNSYVEFSSEQIARLTRERDEARTLVDLERQSRQRCHENAELVLHQQRVQSYAEAIAAGLFPGKVMEDLNILQQEAIMRQSHAGIEALDKIRASRQASAQASTTKH